MKLSRLRGRKTAEYLRRKGRKWNGKTMRILWLPQAPRHPLVDPEASALYVGTFAPATLSKSAVRRNRMRRRCREALRKEAKELTEISPVTLLICPKSSSLSCAHADIAADARMFLSQFS